MATLFTDAMLVCPARTRAEPGWLLVKDGRIAASSFETAEAPTDENIKQVSCGGQILGPGFVDMRVQSGDPGAEHLETLDSLLHAAAHYGITSLGVLPSTNPVMDNAAMIDSLMLRAGRINKSKLYCYGAATKALEETQMAELGMMASAGAIGFATATSSIQDSQTMRRLMTYAAMFNRHIAHHCADASLSADMDMNEGQTATRLGLIGQPGIAETIILQRDIQLVRLTGAHYHASHISTAASVALLAEAKSEGLPVTADTAPPYFMLNEHAVSGFDSAAKLNPPLRSEQDRLAIIEGLKTGVIDAIASDHVPVDPDEKTQPFSLASFGASGLDVLVPLTLKLRLTEQLSWPQFFQLVSLNPARILGIEAGSLHIGAAADLVQINPDTAYQLSARDFLSLSRITPFEGTPCEGRVTGAWIDGRDMMNELQASS